MDPDISEFSYGYVLTNELISSYSLYSPVAPMFPSLYAEGELGFDVEIRSITPLFLQFKLSHYMVRMSAEGASLLGIRHYRFYLRPIKHSRQHELLMALEIQGQEVYYAAPEFHTRDQLNDAYSTQNVVQSSAFFSPNDIGQLPSPDEHFVCFSPGAVAAYRFSEPKRIKKKSLVHVIGDEIPTKIRSRRRPIPSDFRNLGDNIVELHKSHGGRSVLEEQDSFSRIRAEHSPLSYLSYVSQTLLGCALLLRVDRE